MTGREVAMGGFLLAERPIESIDQYLATETGGLGLARAQELGAAGTVDEVTRAGLRGRGGGGFPTGRKWAGVRAQDTPPRTVVANGAEGEPGSFKDRQLLRTNPYQVIEGLMIAALAIDAVDAYIACKASHEHEVERVARAVQELQQAGLCHDCPVTVVAGPDDYLYGEEKALLEVVEGNAPLPRVLPPYIEGLFGGATAVNNVETLANVAHIMARGAEWFRSMGTTASPGTQVCTVVGDVTRPMVREVEMGTPLRELLHLCGVHGQRAKAVYSGVSNPVLTADALDVDISYEAFDAIGSGLGAAGFIVYGDDACMVRVARDFSRFLAVESCGQCPPCKLGSTAITERLDRIDAGDGDDSDVVAIAGWLAKVTDGNRCYLAVEERVVVDSTLRAFASELEEHITSGRCPRPRELPFPLVADIDDGTVTYTSPATR